MNTLSSALLVVLIAATCNVEPANSVVATQDGRKAAEYDTGVFALWQPEKITDHGGGKFELEYPTLPTAWFWYQEGVMPIEVLWIMPHGTGLPNYVTPSKSQATTHNRIEYIKSAKDAGITSLATFKEWVVDEYLDGFGKTITLEELDEVHRHVVLDAMP